MLPFSQIEGQQRALTAIVRDLLGDRIPNAYLFYGPDAVGKRTAAFALAQRLNCTGAAADAPDACGLCPNCRRIAHDNFIPLALLAPEPDARSIKIAQVRELQEQLVYKTDQGLHRLALVDEAQRLTPQAQNALLKTVEEPPPQTLVVLIADRLDFILPTIRSRCRLIGFNALPQRVIRRRLADLDRWDASELDALTALSQGSLNVLDEVWAENLLELYVSARETLGFAAAGRHDALMEQAYRIGRPGFDLPPYLDLLQSLLRDAAAATLGIHSAADDDPALALVRRLGPDRAADLVMACERARYEILERNLNRELALDALFLDFTRA